MSARGVGWVERCTQEVAGAEADAVPRICNVVFTLVETASSWPSDHLTSVADELVEVRSQPLP